MALALGKGKKLHDKRDDREAARRRARDGARGAHPMIALLARGVPARRRRRRRPLARARRAGREPERVACRSSHPPTGPMLRAEQLRPMHPASTVSHAPASGTMLDRLAARHRGRGRASRFVRVGDDQFQLAARAGRAAGVLYVPLQLVVELIPRVVGEHSLGSDASSCAPSRRCAVRRSRRGAAGSTPPAAPRRDDDRSRRRSAHRRSRSRRPPSRASAAQRRLVVVDAGHGGADNGMRGPIGGGPKINEKDITLAVAKRARRGAQAARHRRRCTRARRDTLIALDDRGRIANDAHGAICSSRFTSTRRIPAGRIPAARAASRRTSSPRRRPRTRAASSRWRTRSCKFETRHRRRATDDPLSFILSDMAQNEHLRESSELAELIQRRLGRDAPGSEPRREAGGLPRARDGVHAGGARRDRIRHERRRRRATCPTRRSRTRSPAAIADAALEYLERYERRVARRHRDAGSVSRSERRRSALAVQSRLISRFRIRSCSPPAPPATAHELAGVVDLDALGGLVTKAVSPRAARGRTRAARRRVRRRDDQRRRAGESRRRRRCGASICRGSRRICPRRAQARERRRVRGRRVSPRWSRGSSSRSTTATRGALDALRAQRELPEREGRRHGVRRGPGGAARGRRAARARRRGARSS